jgi:hypothetical protein
MNLPGNGSAQFNQYNYFDGQRSVDNNGFPTPTTTVQTVLGTETTDTTGTTDISDIYATTYAPANAIPAGTQYIRANLANDPLMWAPQIGTITLAITN